MSNNTHLDELVEFPRLVVSTLFKEQMVLDLLADKKNASIDDMEDEDGNWLYIFDYEHVPGTQQEVKVAICVDTDIVAVPNRSTKRLELYVSVFCSQAHMGLDRRKFIGLPGNRMNNLLRYIDRSLRLSRDFGIGQLELKNVRTVTSGNPDYAKKTITYMIPDFNLDRGVANSLL